MATSLRRALRACTVLIVGIGLLILLATPAWAQATITVTVSADNTTGGDGFCTLREALANANGNVDTTGGDCTAGIGGTDVIEFDITTLEGAGPHTISPTGVALNASESVTIDGYTETGAAVNTATVCSNATLMVVIDASGISAGPGGQRSGLRLTSASTVRGLVVHSAPHASGGWGIQIAPTGGGSTVEGNFIGTNAAGTSALPNLGAGVYINNSAGSTIGGTTAAARNIISGNAEEGVRISNALATGNVVAGNCIGTDATGLVALPNGAFSGVLINRGATMNTIGGANGTPGGNCTGACNVISGNTGDGVFITRANNVRSNDNDVLGNYIGTVPSGLAALPNGDNGVEIQSSDDNTIGGTPVTERNVIAGNTTAGVKIASGASTGNVVLGNYVGVDAACATALPNGTHGVVVQNGATLNTVGGTAPGAGNVISGNTASGVHIKGDFGGGITSTGNEVVGNFIGTDEAGTAMLGNGANGVLIQDNAIDTIVGGTTAAHRNIISNNGASGAPSDQNGIRIINTSTTGTVVQGNFIGTDILGTGDLGNVGNGVVVGETDMTTIGGTTGVTVGGDCTGACNLISGNGATGININGGATNTTVEGNYIGTDIDADTDLGNDGIGVLINQGSSLSAIGGSTAAARNIISGNDATFGGGVVIQESSFDNTVTGNYIGTDAAGTGALGNTSEGVFISSSATTNTIGGTTGITPGGDCTGECNLISSNGEEGIVITGGATMNTVESNYIGTEVDGTSALGNTNAGVLITGDAPSNTIGGTGAGNTIAFNGTDGVIVTGDGSIDNTISENAIFNNTGIGIDLANDGVTPNDGADADGSPNNLQNTPVITAFADAGGGMLDITYFVDTATGNATYPLTVEFFAADTDEEEGETLLGTDTYTAGDFTGGPSKMITIASSVPAVLLATATDSDGNTSEFSVPVVDLEVTKTESLDPVVAGSGTGNLTYVVTVTNNGPADASGVELDEVLTLPSGVTIDSVTPSAGSFSDPTWTLGMLAAGASETLTVVLTVASSAAEGTDVIDNTATVTAVNETDVDPANDSATEATSVTREVDLEVTKTESLDPVVAGSGTGNLTYVVTVTNNGPSDASGVELDEVLTLPSGVTVASVTPSTGSFSDPTWTLGALANGASETLTVVLTVDSSTAEGIDVIDDTATITAVNETDTDGGNDAATEATSVTREVDLEVTKTESADPVEAGSGTGNLTYTITVTNNGPSDASGVEVEEVLTLPAGVSVESITPSAGAFADPTWTVGDLASGASETLTVVLTVGAGTPMGVDIISDTATITAVNETDTDPANDTVTEATSVDIEADLRIDKTVSASTPDFGSTITYTITVTNDGPADASGVVITDALPAGLTYVSDDGGGSYDPGSGEWSVGSLTVGATATLAITVQVDTVDPVTNTAAVTASNLPDPITSNNSESVGITPIASDLAIAKTLTDFSGDAETVAASFTLTVTNNGPTDATGVEVSDPVPEGATLESASGAYSATTGLWTIGALDVGDSATLTLVVTGEAGNDLINVAEVSGDQPDQDPGNNIAGAQAQHSTDVDKFVADLSVTKTVDNATPSVGQMITYTLTVTNSGPSSAAGVVVRDALSDSLTFVSASLGDASDSYDAATGQWQVGQLKIGDTATLELEVEVTGSGAIVNVAQVWASTLPDPDSSIPGRASEDAYASATITASGAEADSQAKSTATEGEAGVPVAFQLRPNYPNPFNPTTTIPYEVPEAAHLHIAVYDVLGREVAVLVDRRVSAGRYEVVWEAGSRPTGVYLVRMQAGGRVHTHRVTLMK